MDVTTVSTVDQSLLTGVRNTLRSCDDALLCVAFVHPRGVHLIENELKGVARRGSARLVVTTTFDQSGGTALSVASTLGAKVRTLNPGAGTTYHPKVYLGRAGKQVHALVGSANLTGGLATNVEVGVLLRGTIRDRPLRELCDWAESMWSDRRCDAWQTDRVAEHRGDDELDAALLEQLSREVARQPVFETLGRPAQNRVVDVSRSEVIVETGRTRQRGTGPASIPAWMLNIAWDYLHAHGELTNKTLLNHLRVHRSSAVCAMLARLPGIERLPGRAVGVRLASQSSAANTREKR